MSASSRNAMASGSTPLKETAPIRSPEDPIPWGITKYLGTGLSSISSSKGFY